MLPLTRTRASQRCILLQAYFSYSLVSGAASLRYTAARRAQRGSWCGWWASYTHTLWRPPLVVLRRAHALALITTSTISSWWAANSARRFSSISTHSPSRSCLNIHAALGIGVSLLPFEHPDCSVVHYTLRTTLTIIVLSGSYVSHNSLAGSQCRKNERFFRGDILGYFLS